MARKPFLLRIDEKVLADIQRWADDDLRSLNAQIEWLLRTALNSSGRRRSEAGQVNIASGETRSGK